LTTKEHGSLTLTETRAPAKLVGGAVIEGFPGAGLAYRHMRPPTSTGNP
jgi:hypothetical protein